jgi:hypothetical protein
MSQDPFQQLKISILILSIGARNELFGAWMGKPCEHCLLVRTPSPTLFTPELTVGRTEDTRIDGSPILHYPLYPTRLQLGIWDASSPSGTSAWAKGPIDWEKAPEVISAIVKSVTVECPYL